MEKIYKLCVMQGGAPSPWYDRVDPIFEVFIVGSGEEQSGSRAILSSEPSASSGDLGFEPSALDTLLDGPHTQPLGHRVGRLATVKI